MPCVGCYYSLKTIHILYSIQNKKDAGWPTCALGHGFVPNAELSG